MRKAKYKGPCPDHLEFVHDCLHCKAIRERQRYRYASATAPYAVQGIPIYPLHYPAHQVIEEESIP